MFTFFHRKPKIVVDCFTTNADAYEYAPIVQTKKTLPDWWKNLPVINKNVFPPDNTSNMKQCYGFNELYKRGVVIESWADFKIKIEGDKYEYYYSNFNSPSEHGRDQYSGAFDNHLHIKLNSPWHIKEKTGIYFAFIGAEWALDKYDFKVLPGILQYRTVDQTNINIMMLKKPDPYILEIKMGQPLVQLIPLRDDLNYEYKTHLISQGEYDTFFPRASVNNFLGLRSSIKLDKRNQKRNESKCPFH
jgi:hypothetical protein